MEMQSDFSVVSIFYFLAAAALMLAVKFHFPQHFLARHIARVLRINRALSD